MGTKLVWYCTRLVCCCLVGYILVLLLCWWSRMLYSCIYGVLWCPNVDNSLTITMTLVNEDGDAFWMFCCHVGLLHDLLLIITWGIWIWNTSSNLHLEANFIPRNVPSRFEGRSHTVWRYEQLSEIHASIYANWTRFSASKWRYVMPYYTVQVVVGYWTHVDAVIGVLILYPLYHHEDGSWHQKFIDIRVPGMHIGL